MARQIQRAQVSQPRQRDYARVSNVLVAAVTWRAEVQVGQPCTDILVGQPHLLLPMHTMQANMLNALVYGQQWCQDWNSKPLIYQSGPMQAGQRSILCFSELPFLKW